MWGFMVVPDLASVVGALKLLGDRKLWVPVALFVLLGACGLLMLPQPVAEGVGLYEVVSKHRPLVGGLGFAGLVLLTTVGTLATCTRVSAWLKRRTRLRIMRARLGRLTPDEKRVLKPFLDGNTRSRRLPIDDGTVAELASVGVLIRLTTVGDMYDGFAFNLQPWAWTYLNERPDLVAEDGNQQVARHAQRT